jgi:FkbH-like protein
MAVTDKFGDEGVVGVAIVRKSSEEWVIDSFLMSCRVIGRSAETALLAKIVRDAKRAGINKIKGEFIPTKKNPPAQDLYERHGFGSRTEDDGVASWILDLNSNMVEVPEWIELIEE